MHHNGYANLTVPVGNEEALPASWPVPLQPTFVTSDPREIVRFLHDVVELSDAEIAEAIGVAADVTVRRWRAHDEAGTPRRTRGIDDLRAITGLLLNSRLLYPDEVGRFLRARNEHLGFRRPLAVLAEGDFDHVRSAAENLIAQLASRHETEADSNASRFDSLPDGMSYHKPTDKPRPRECRCAASYERTSDQ